jgi:hypothetical protein
VIRDPDTLPKSVSLPLRRPSQGACPAQRTLSFGQFDEKKPMFQSAGCFRQSNALSGVVAQLSKSASAFYIWGLTERTDRGSSSAGQCRLNAS